MEKVFCYDALFEYENLTLINIGGLINICHFCSAKTWKGESANICCSNGEVSLPNYNAPPEPMKSLIHGTHPMSKHFMKVIRKYNNCFNMTSFKTSANVPQNIGFMPTFKDQGQIYHRAGSLLPMQDEPPKFLQIYFVGDEISETETRSGAIPGTETSLIQKLQRMLHMHNEYVRTLKMALEENQGSGDLQIIIKANKRPADGHARVYNAPTVNEVAIIINGIEFEKRDIVLKKRSNDLQTICETHIAYDPLQYPLMFPRGENGYAINRSKLFLEQILTQLKTFQQ